MPVIKHFQAHFNKVPPPVLFSPIELLHLFPIYIQSLIKRKPHWQKGTDLAYLYYFNSFHFIFHFAVDRLTKKQCLHFHKISSFPHILWIFLSKLLEVISKKSSIFSLCVNHFPTKIIIICWQRLDLGSLLYNI